VQFGETNRACPFYLSREWQKDAEIIFTPYNYIIDKSIRESLNIDLENCKPSM
jgi:regulator of telomere elongation helicase 1